MDGFFQFVVLANAALLASFLLMYTIDLFLKATPIRHAYKLRLNLAAAALCAAMAPLVFPPLTKAAAWLMNFNATDIFVSQYLKGNIALTATQIEDVLSVKDSVTTALTNGSSNLSVLLIAMLSAAFLARAGYIGLNIGRVSKLTKNATLMHQTRRVKMMHTDKVKVPFSTRGLRFYYIVLPTSILKDREAMAIALGHESQHIRQRDVDWEILLSVISPLFALNPAFWLVSDRIRRFREYSCDAAFLSRRGVSTKQYCHTLLDIATSATRSWSKHTSYSTSVPFIGRKELFSGSKKSALKRRVVAMANKNPLNSRFGRAVAALPAVTLVCAMIFGAAAFSKPADWSHDRLMLSTVVNLERLDRINSFGQNFGERPFR